MMPQKSIIGHRDYPPEASLILDLTQEYDLYTLTSLKHPQGVQCSRSYYIFRESDKVYIKMLRKIAFTNHWLSPLCGGHLASEASVVVCTAWEGLPHY